MPIYPTDYTEEDYESDMAELRKEDKMKEQEEEIEQAVDERTFADARDHTLRAAVLVELFLKKSGNLTTLERAHEAATKAFNTITYLEENQ